MRILDLFAGIGGFSLAAHWMGWETAAFVERDKFCQKVLRKNFGEGIEIHDDIFEFSGKPFRGAVDIVTGGFPCQPFSAAGKRRGRADERHLFPEMLRVIREVCPRWVVAENVRGLLSIESGAVFAEVVTSLEGEGYEVITFCVPASAVGAPHRRDRLWIVGRRDRGAGGIGSGNDTNAERDGRGRDSREMGGSGSGRDHLLEHGQSPANNGERLGFRDEVASDDIDASHADRQRERAGYREIQGPDGEISERDDDAESINADIVHAPNTASIGRRQRWAEPTGLGGQPASVGSGGSGRDVRNPTGTGAEAFTPFWHRPKSNSDRGDGDVGHSKGTGQPSGVDGSRQGEHGRTGAWIDEHWSEVATRLCGISHGLPDELDIAGARDNRVSRLKALGNSVVPVIPFEIFKAIEAATGHELK